MIQGADTESLINRKTEFGRNILPTNQTFFLDEEDPPPEIKFHRGTISAKTQATKRLREVAATTRCHRNDPSSQNETNHTPSTFEAQYKCRIKRQRMMRACHNTTDDRETRSSGRPPDQRLP